MTRSLVAACVLALVCAVSTSGQSQYVPVDVNGLNFFAEHGSHLGTTALSGSLDYIVGGRFSIGVVAGTGRVEDPFDLYSGDDPRLTFYRPRVSLNIPPRLPSRAEGLLLSGGYELQDFTHPDIQASGELTARGLMLDATIYRIILNSPSMDIYLDGSFTYYRLAVKASAAGASPAEEVDPTNVWGAGMAFVFNQGAERKRRAVLRPWLSVIEGDLSFGVSVGLLFLSAPAWI